MGRRRARHQLHSLYCVVDSTGGIIIKQNEKSKNKKMAVTLVCNDHFMNRLLYFLVSRVCDTLLVDKWTSDEEKWTSDAEVTLSFSSNSLKHPYAFSLYITLLAPLVIFRASGCSLMNESIWRTRFSSSISSTAIKMPVSSTYHMQGKSLIITSKDTIFG